MYRPPPPQRYLFSANRDRVNRGVDAAGWLFAVPRISRDVGRAVPSVQHFRAAQSPAASIFDVSLPNMEFSLMK